MNATIDNGSAPGLLARTLQLIKERHGDWIAAAPETRELVSTMIDIGISDEADMVEMVELAEGKRYDRTTARFQ